MRSSGDGAARRHHLEEAPPRANALADVSDAIEVRAGTPEDAEAIAQLLYQNYHLSYVHADFYRPRYLIAGLATGELLSAVAVHDGQRGRAPRADAAPRYPLRRDGRRGRPLRLSRARSLRPDVRAHARRGGRGRLRVRLRRCRHDPSRSANASRPRTATARLRSSSAWSRLRRRCAASAALGLLDEPPRSARTVLSTRVVGKPRCRPRIARCSRASTRMSGSRSRRVPSRLRLEGDAVTLDRR